MAAAMKLPPPFTSFDGGRLSDRVAIEAEIHYHQPGRAALLDLVTGAGRYGVSLQPGPGEDAWSGNITIPSSPDGMESVQVTPKEPFVKGTALPAKLISIRLLPLH